MSTNPHFTLTNATKAKLPRLAFAHMEEMKDAALGKKYDLSVAVVSPATIRALNKTYRKLDQATDILSFPLSDTSGEIYLCLSEAKKEAVKFARPYENFISFLFIHGLVHLNGYDHGSRMEEIESALRKRWNI